MQLLHPTGGQRRSGRVAALALLLALAAGAAGQQAAGPRPAAASLLDRGTVQNGIYRNSALGIECAVPAGWVLQTEAISQAESGVKGNSVVLFSAFARAPHTSGAGVNSSILIAAESRASNPEVSTALEYLVLVKEAAHLGGLELTQPPRATQAGQRTLWRADFASDPEPGSGPGSYQISEVMLARGYFVSFTFVAGGREAAESLLANLHFTPPRGTLPGTWNASPR